MYTTNNAEPSDAPVSAGMPVLLKKLAIWAMFLVLLYLARDFFFTAFMTFLFCYMTLSVVGWGMRRLSPDHDRPWLRRLLTVGVFVLAPLLLFGVGVMIGPRLLEQGHRLGGWMSQTTPEMEAAHLLEGFIGPSEFKREYGDPDSPAYQKAIAEFREKGHTHVAAYNQFPKQEAWVEAGFLKQFTQAQHHRIRARVNHEGTSSKEFEQWFLQDKVPELQALARKHVPEKGGRSPGASALVRAAASATPDQLLAQARHDPTALAALRQEWLDDSLQKGTATAQGTPEYHEQFRQYYERQRAASPTPIPYTFDQYIELQAARRKGPGPFGETMEKIHPSGDGDARLTADFEAAKKHELFEHWWSTDSTAAMIRQQLHHRVAGDGATRLENIILSLINVPMDIGTALLLSIFICIDFPNLRRGFQRLEDTRFRDVYLEMAPALSGLGQLIGRSMHAQGLIALCNAVLIFIALRVLGVEHEFLLSLAVFVLCLIPTLGAAIALVLVSLAALVQPGGGPVLAMKAAGAVVMVMLVESFVLSPRILGRMMEVHPVLLIALLPVAQYFFGVWGLILATPVAVYVIHVLILGHGLPGNEAREPTTPGVAAGAASTIPKDSEGIDNKQEAAAP